jgi:CRP/FNR family cyclic AMP-dependent transcriptional regulator
MISLEASAGLPGFTEDPALYEDALSSALTTVFRGNFCDAILPGRTSVTFRRDEVLYELGAGDRTFFFIRSGFIKIGTLTQDGREIIYDVRKAGGVAGELCACQSVRRDRAVALEPSEAIPVPYCEIVDALQKSPALFVKLIELFCDCLADAYQQVNALAFHDTARRLTHVLLGLASRIGRDAGSKVEIPTYLTQEDISQMVAARRERVSTALNLLRRRGMVHYSNDGHLLLDVKALESRAF